MFLFVCFTNEDTIVQRSNGYKPLAMWNRQKIEFYYPLTKEDSRISIIVL